MIKVGLTGGMACGKSTVGKMFAELGAYVIKADEVAHELMRPGQPVHVAIVAAFGHEILGENGEIDRKRLADAAFGHNRISELNAIVHPSVIEQERQWMREIGKREPQAIAIAEAALTFEAGSYKHFDKVVVVTCRPEQRAERFARRQGLSIEAAQAEVERRMRTQISDEEKARRADYVIDNSGSEEATRKQVQHVYSELKCLALH